MGIIFKQRVESQFRYSRKVMVLLKEDENDIRAFNISLTTGTQLEMLLMTVILIQYLRLNWIISLTLRQKEIIVDDDQMMFA